MRPKLVQSFSLGPDGSPVVQSNPKEAQDVFTGEMMKCAVCGKKQLSHPKVTTQWRAFKLPDKTLYACPDHFPRDGASVEEFEKAYRTVFKTLAAHRKL